MVILHRCNVTANSRYGQKTKDKGRATGLGESEWTAGCTGSVIMYSQNASIDLSIFDFSQCVFKNVSKLFVFHDLLGGIAPTFNKLLGELSRPAPHLIRLNLGNINNV